MSYPASATTYKLPFDGKIRVSSRCRYILVRWLSDPNGNADAKPYIVRRSDDPDVIAKEFAPRFDYSLDQVTGLVVFHFNGHAEKFDGKTGEHLGRV